MNEHTQGLLAFLLGRAPELSLKLLQQLYLVGIAMGSAMLVGIPIGIWAARNTHFRGLILGGTNVLQTIPSLALLALIFAVCSRKRA